MQSAILARLILMLSATVPMSIAAQYVVRGVVLDERGDLPLVGAHVQVVGQAVGTYTDHLGRFEVRSVERHVPLRVTYVGFKELERRADARVTALEPLLIRLEPIAIELPVAEVRPAGPEVVFERKDLHVGDYLVNDQGLWVLVYGRKQLMLRQGLAGQTFWHGTRVHLLDTIFREVANGSLPGTTCSLEHDHCYRPVVKAANEAWALERDGDALSIGHIDEGTYRNAVIPWTDSIPHMLIGNTWLYEYPAFEHVAYDALKGKQQVICEVVDEFWMAIFRGNYKYMSGRSKVLAMDMAMEHGTDPEIIAGFMVGIDADLRYRPPYAPLYVLDDTLCVFDHYKERIRRFDRFLQPVDEVPITYHRDRDWDHNVVMDRATSAVYARFARGSATWLQRIEPNTGGLGASTRLTHPYPEDVQVHDGYAYYVYRPFGSPQKRTLYREPLR